MFKEQITNLRQAQHRNNISLIQIIPENKIMACPDSLYETH